MCEFSGGQGRGRPARSLEDYLETKRASFPRFYFVSDANLLEILSQGSNPAAIQPHLQSVFASVVRVEFDPSNGQKIVTLFDTTGESIELEKPVEMVGNIEDWLDKLLSGLPARCLLVLGHKCRGPGARGCSSRQTPT